ncbi:hypothetical protein THAOC_28100 [Thalassiosira oceanica]|uniref:RxLR effector protein n=1 Tax=Thalassiosira oceanica TaxID=159749 RepID=K0RUT1_THAOC|nr:hypothetical protein THAOC_28287 [Thalassiosira oceanica]EJK52606.1 hypothetical protein THAOC_28100 [Thalassiosira oceanica]|mmetsp:Transcript_10065/g.23536  ORF Transcript_10065/g.23536 Transcript_10065/m.23536 type:complete len:90 (-) Transcript_10065:131-400(-)|eukprot:EJK52432.1 hypothetical protein THAOC_28287 [Thalassiosira oceanica]
MKTFSTLAALAFLLVALLPTSSAKRVRRYRGTQDQVKDEIVKRELDVDSKHRRAKGSKNSKKGDDCGWGWGWGWGCGRKLNEEDVPNDI